MRGREEKQDDTVVKQGSVAKKNQDGLIIEDCMVNGFAATLLRDTGCNTVGIRRSLVSPDQYTGTNQKCQTFGGKVETFPIAKISVHTPYFEGTVEACVIDDPVADLILGNVPGIRTNHGGKGGSVALVTTRAQAENDRKNPKPLPMPKIDKLDVSPDELKELQKADESLKKCFEQVVPERALDKNTHCFVSKEGVLTRLYQSDTEVLHQIVVPKPLRLTVLQVSHDIPMAGHFGVRRTLSRVLLHFYWPTVRQDVNKYCQSCDACQRTIPRGRIPCAPLEKMPVITQPFQRIAIDLVGPISPASTAGHTHILTIVDVATRYPEAIPLKKIDSVTVAEALFSVFARMGCPEEILSDCGTQFISGLMKELHRLLSIKTVTTTPYHPQSNGMVERFNGTLKAMLKKVVQDEPKTWDRMVPAVLFAYRELPNASTGYSPFELLFGRQARGPTFLLAQSWSGQQLVQEDRLAFQYVFDLKNKMLATCDIVRQNVEEATKTNKRHADKKAKRRTFDVGQKVLVLLTDDQNKLLAKWKGPYRVLEKVSAVDYKIDMASVVKVFHVNMLKLYVDRCEQDIQPIAVNTSVSQQKPEVDQEIPWSDLVTHTYAPQQQYGNTNHDSLFRKEAAGSNPVMSVCVGVVKEREDDIAKLPTIPTIKGETYQDANISDKLGRQDRQKVEKLLEEFQDVLTDKPGKAKGVVPHRINLTDETPVRLKPYPLPFSTRQVVEQEVHKMLKLGVIEPSTSAYCSPVVLVGKPDGSVRFCIDYRVLNKRTIFDCEPMPDVEELFCSLAQANYFAKIDLTKGYWQIPIEESDKHKTAFQTPLGLFQWTRMPFGLQNAPATFARAMRCLNLKQHDAVNFVDDVLISACDVCGLIEKLRAVLQTLRNFGLCAKPSKVFVGYPQLDFLGHTLEAGQLKPQDDKVSKIVNANIPKTKRQVRALLGLIGYYRRYIPNFAEIAAPLTDLTKDSAPRSVKWTQDCATALQHLQEMLLRKPILKLPDLSKDFTLRTDASAKGMGGVLLQEHDGLFHPVKCISQKFSETQLRYSTVEWECLAIVWATTKLSRFLIGRHFTLQTDHKPLTFLHMSRTRNNHLLNWALTLTRIQLHCYTH